MYCVVASIVQTKQHGLKQAVNALLSNSFSPSDHPTTGIFKRQIRELHMVRKEEMDYWMLAVTMAQLLISQL